MLEVCAGFIEHAKAGPNAMRPKELCSACEMCNEHEALSRDAAPGRLSRALVAVLGLHTAELAGVSLHGIEASGFGTSLAACIYAYGNKTVHINARTCQIQSSRNAGMVIAWHAERMQSCSWRCQVAFDCITANC